MTTLIRRLRTQNESYSSKRVDLKGNSKKLLLNAVVVVFGLSLRRTSIPRAGGPSPQLFGLVFWTMNPCRSFLNFTEILTPRRRGWCEPWRLETDLKPRTYSHRESWIAEI